MIDKEKLYASLNSQGTKTVREKVALGVFGRAKLKLIEEWLCQQDELRLSEAASKTSSEQAASIAVAREANEISREALSSAREANRIARHQKNIAIIALVVAIVMSITAIITVLINIKQEPNRNIHAESRLMNDSR